jgi:hypothetical protein
VGFVECFAKRSLAHRKGATHGRNLKWLIYLSESQLLRTFDQLAGRLVPREGPFLHRYDPSMDSHCVLYPAIAVK